jgi:hypothetical protein
MRWPGVFAILGLLAACGTPGASAPFHGWPVDGASRTPVGPPAHVARDTYGIAHLNAETGEIVAAGASRRVRR